MENWKAIPGFEGIYEASTHGRIRSAEGKTTYSDRWGVVHWKQRIQKQHFCRRKSGDKLDARVTLWKDKVPHYFLVSRLIALTWCEGYEDGLTVNHIDGDTLNNHADNLEWISRSENIRKAFESGMYPSTTVILTDSDGTQIMFPSMAQASRHLGRNPGYISMLLHRDCRVTPEGYSVSFPDDSD